MPLSIHGDALGKAKNLMPQIFAGDDHDAGAASEDRRRRATAVTEATATPVVQSAQPASAPSPITVRDPERPAAVIDRFHKYATNVRGGYIMVAHDHDEVDTDQIPPLNPGYAPLGKASSIQEAYLKAVQMLAVTTMGRIAIVIVGGRWDESLIIDQHHIDFYGMGRPMLYGHQHILPLADAKFFDMEFSSPDKSEAMIYFADPDMDPTVLPAEIRDCNFFGSGNVFRSQRRIYAERCQFKQIVPQGQAPKWTDMIIPVTLEQMVMEGQAGTPPYDGNEWVFENCRFESWMKSGVYGQRPGGWAVECRSVLPATKSHTLWSPNPLYFVPNHGFRFHKCNIQGTMFVNAAKVTHEHCTLAGGIDTVTAASSIYALIRSMPMFDDSGYMGSQGGVCIIDHSAVHAFYVAAHQKNPGSPNPSYGGETYLVMTHSKHYRTLAGVPSRIATSIGTPNIAHHQIASSSTGAHDTSPGAAPGSEWLAPGGVTATYGDCPTNVVALADNYMI